MRIASRGVPSAYILFLSLPALWSQRPTAHASRVTGLIREALAAAFSQVSRDKATCYMHNRPQESLTLGSRDTRQRRRHKSESNVFDFDSWGGAGVSTKYTERTGK